MQSWPTRPFVHQLAHAGRRRGLPATVAPALAGRCGGISLVMFRFWHDD
jgi:hypothetical protein